MILKCEYCSKRFAGKNCARYCSPACRQASYRRNRAEKLQQLRAAENQTLTTDEWTLYTKVLVHCGNKYHEILNGILLATSRDCWEQTLRGIIDLLNGNRDTMEKEEACAKLDT